MVQKGQGQGMMVCATIGGCWTQQSAKHVTPPQIIQTCHTPANHPDMFLLLIHQRYSLTWAVMDD